MTKMTDIPGYREAREVADEWNESLNISRKRSGLSIGDVVAMSPGNDPFWMTPGKVLKAEWAQRIMDNVIKQHLRRIRVNDIHLRDIHYILTGMNYRTWDGSEVYLNTDAHWSDLITAFANARYLDLVDPELIRDNKNKYDKRTDYRQDYDFVGRVDYGKRDLDKDNVLDLFISWFNGLKNWHNHMPVHIEIWAEKDLALLEQVANRYKINTVVGEGETSVTMVYRIIDRIKKAGKPVRLAYVADCDPVGSNMSKAMSRKMEFIISQLEDEDVDVKLTHLMLTPTQVNQYGLPTIPMKSSKSEAYETRKDEWMLLREMEGAVEINSFHALHPDEFRDILERFILSYFDEEIKDMVIGFNREQSENIGELIGGDKEINTLLDELLKKLKGAIDDIDWKEKESDYDTEFTEMLSDHESLGTDYPERDEHYQWLLDTELGYGEQLNRYVEYEAGRLDNPEEDKE